MIWHLWVVEAPRTQCEDEATQPNSPAERTQQTWQRSAGDSFDLVNILASLGFRQHDLLAVSILNTHIAIWLARGLFWCEESVIMTYWPLADIIRSVYIFGYCYGFWQDRDILAIIYFSTVFWAFSVLLYPVAVLKYDFLTTIFTHCCLSLWCSIKNPNFGQRSNLGRFAKKCNNSSLGEYSAVLQRYIILYILYKTVT